MGQVYVAPMAENTDQGGNNNRSGGSIPTGGAWLYWTESGYTGQEWYWDDPNNYLKTGWENLIAETGGDLEGCDTKHDSSYKSFLQHVEFDHAANLDNILGPWPTREKTHFITSHENLETAGCVEWL